eukprot:4189153-Prymnesium_polylepis.1
MTSAVGATSAKALMVRHGARRRGYSDKTDSIHLYFRNRASSSHGSLRSQRRKNGKGGSFRGSLRSLVMGSVSDLHSRNDLRARRFERQSVIQLPNIIPETYQLPKRYNQQGQYAEASTSQCSNGEISTRSWCSIACGLRKLRPKVLVASKACSGASDSPRRSL